MAGCVLSLSCRTSGHSYSLLPSSVRRLHVKAINCPEDDSVENIWRLATCPDLEPMQQDAGLPRFLLPGQLLQSTLDLGIFAMCQDGVFREPAMQKVVGEINRRYAMPPAGYGDEYGPWGTLYPEQKALTTALSYITTWRYERVPQKQYPSRLGQFDLNDRVVTMYEPSCGRSAVRRIYGESIAVSAGVFFWLVASHEFGHVLDALSGELDARDQTQAERQATIYGSIVAQCIMLGAALELYGEAPGERSWISRNAELGRLASCSDWSAMRAALSALRTELLREQQKEVAAQPLRRERQVACDP